MTGSAESDAPLRWHYGPTDTDPDPGKMWCYACGGEVFTFKDGAASCAGCGAYDEPEPETYADAADAMAGPMEPKTPCDVMPTRPCVVWHTGGRVARLEDREFPVTRCAVTCWRYATPIPPG